LRAYIVVDLGFGDSGKGLLTDFLVAHLGAGVVVRYNGGAQAGHNVITADGRHHTYSQFGSGAFHPSVKTYLSRDVVIHPTALLIEGNILEGKGVREPFSHLRLSDQALVITPFHQASNRIRETLRGSSRHGSCGVGVGDAVEDALAHAESSIRAGDLRSPALLRRKLHVLREYKREQILDLCREIPPDSALAREFQVFTKEDVLDAWMVSISRIDELGLIVDDSVLERWLRNTDTVIFEGAQGVLLDADAGFHPYTTWSNCTAVKAFELIQEMAPNSGAFQIGVMRSYAMRHGPGPLPTEAHTLSSLISEHNQYNDWQGAVRYGWFDPVLARYALSVVGKVDSLVVTHMDVLAHLNAWKYCRGYEGWQDLDDPLIDITIFDNLLTSFRLSPLLSLEKRAQFTQTLSTLIPVLETHEADEETVIRKIETLIDQQIGIISRGPCANHVKVLNSLPS
jgi:adenylosuccinate synthase